MSLQAPNLSTKSHVGVKEPSDPELCGLVFDFALMWGPKKMLMNFGVIMGSVFVHG